MKKLLVLVALFVLAALPSSAQQVLNDADIYLVDHYSNNAGPGGPADQQVRLINFAAIGDPLTSPVGDLCASIYVFDANQEMVECCSCRITPNGLRTISVANNLTNNPVTSVVPVNGDIKILSSLADASTCNPVTSPAFTPDPVTLYRSLKGFGTHLLTSGGTSQGTFITETNIPYVALNIGELGFLKQACQFARYLGSGKGVCTCGSGS
jgi:hypothetical protein